MAHYNISSGVTVTLSCHLWCLGLLHWQHFSKIYVLHLPVSQCLLFYISGAEYDCESFMELCSYCSPEPTPSPAQVWAVAPAAAGTPGGPPLRARDGQWSITLALKKDVLWWEEDDDEDDLTVFKIETAVVFFTLHMQICLHIFEAELHLQLWGGSIMLSHYHALAW